MFNAAIVWRGIVFTILMLIGKLVTGVWLIRIAASSGTVATKIKAFQKRLNILQWSCLGFTRFANGFKSEAKKTVDEPGSTAEPYVCTTDDEQRPRQSSDIPLQRASVQTLCSANSTSLRATASTTKSRSLYPASIVGTAMMARGEIGFLIAALAENTGIFAFQDDFAAREDSGSEIYLVTVWAIVLCTVIGPVSVGLLVRRVEKLQRQRREHGGGEDPLGIWGVL